MKRREGNRGTKHWGSQKEKGKRERGGVSGRGGEILAGRKGVRSLRWQGVEWMPAED